MPRIYKPVGPSANKATGPSSNKAPGSAAPAPAGGVKPDDKKKDAGGEKQSCRLSFRRSICLQTMRSRPT